MSELCIEQSESFFSLGLSPRVEPSSVATRLAFSAWSQPVSGAGGRISRGLLSGGGHRGPGAAAPGEFARARLSSRGHSRRSGDALELLQQTFDALPRLRSRALQGRSQAGLGERKEAGRAMRVGACQPHAASARFDSGVPRVVILRVGGDEERPFKSAQGAARPEYFCENKNDL